MKQHKGVRIIIAIFIALSFQSYFIFGNTAVLASNQSGLAYSYDQNGRLVLVAHANNQGVIYQYDLNGNLLSSMKKNLPYINNVSSTDLSAVSYDVVIYGVPQQVQKVEFPTWTLANGQDDLEHPYIQGQKVADGVWRMTIPFSKHNYETGIYATHVYVDGTNFGAVETQVSPSAVTFQAPEQVGLGQGSYDVYVDGVNPRVAKVLFPTWTTHNGQDDLEQPWIEGQRIGEQRWKMTIPFSKHGYETGNYLTDYYAVDPYGNHIMLGGTVTAVHAEISGPGIMDLSSPSYDIYAYGVPPQAQKVEFPTWTLANGQDDLEHPYIQGQKVADGVWRVTISFSKHNYETGAYATHVYVDGTYFGAVGTQVNQAAVNFHTPVQVGLSQSSYDVYVDGVNPRVAKVLFPTWTIHNGQDDLEHPWIEGQRVGEQRWKMTIPFNKHSYETGDYLTDYYAVDPYGNQIRLGGTVTIGNAEVSGPGTASFSNGSYHVYVYGVPKQAVKVEFPTWTAANGQDDLEHPYILGQKVTDGVWRVTIPFSKHNNETGIYLTDVYVDGVHFGGIQTQVY